MNKDERVEKTHVMHKGTQRRRPSKPDIIRDISPVGTGGLGIYPEDMTLTEMLETPKPHDHLCLIYESKEEWRAAVIPFLAIGLKRGEKCIYVIDTSTADEIRKYLGKEGIDAAAAEKAGQLVILHETDAYTREDSFDPDRMIDLLISETEKAVDEGYPALRVTGEMTWVRRSYPGSEKLLEYEAKLNSDLFPRYPCLSICQYDLRKFDPEIIKGVIVTHPILVHGNRIYHNFYYVPPEDFLNHKRAEKEAQHWLNNIERERQMRQELVESRQKYIELADNLNSGMAVYEAVDDGEDFIFVDFNRAGERIEKISRDEVIGKSVLKVFPGVKEFGLFEVFQRVWRTGKPERYPVTLYKDNRIAGWRDNYVYKLPEGEIVAIYDDITELKKAGEVLMESEEKYRNLVERARDGICIIQDRLVKYANLRQAEMWGGAVEELINTPFVNYIYLDELPMVIDRYNRRMAGEQVPSVYEATLRRKDGSKVYAELNVGIINHLGKPAELVITRDITERKRAEEALRESEDKFSKAFNSNPDAVVISQLVDGKILEVNDAWEGLLGYSREEVIGKSSLALNFLSPLDRQHAVALLEKQGFVREFELEVRRKSGDVRQVNLSSEGIEISGKRCMLTTIHDITERKQAEQALLRSEENFRRTLEDSPLGIRIVTDDGETLYTNQALLDIYGYASFEEFKKSPVKKRYTPESYIEHQLRKKKRMQGKCVPSNYEISIVRKDGEIRHLEVLRKEVLWDGRTQFQVIYQDITERKLLETERQRIEKLESIGTLAGGIAHDFNNLLTGIMGNISLARRYVEPKGKAIERLEKAEIASIRAKDLTQQLLTFSRGGSPVKAVISIGKLIQESAGFALRGSKIKPEFSLPDDLWAVEADEGQIIQVFNNIIINADQAMPRGGVINIAVKNIIIRGKSVLPLPTGNYVHIAIKDRGVGIPREHLSKIFDPFFTTKQKGSGLGLATAYSIVKNHSGYITVESKPGTGTTVHVYMPASKKPALAEDEVVMETTLRGKGRILVMDDEEIIREMLSKMLSIAGYEVELTPDGAETIERYAKAKRAKKPFDAVIMDLTIPGGMGGKEAITKLLEIDPNAKVVVSSGYATDPIMSGYKKCGFSAVVTKPYSAAEIERTLYSLLGNKK